MRNITKSIDMYKNTIYCFAAKGTAGICFFCLDILAARMLGYDFYNEWNFYFSIAVFLRNFTRFGIDAASKIYIARLADDTKKQAEFFVSGLKLEILLSAAVFVLELALSCPFSWILGYPEKYPHLYPLFLSGIIFTSAYSVLCFFKDASVGFLEYKNLFMITAAEFLSYLVFSYLGIRIWGIAGLGAGHSASVCIAAAFGCCLYRHKLRGFYSSCRYMKDILKLAASLIFVNIGGLILSEMDVFMLGLFSQKQVGIYAAAKNLLDKAVNVPLAVCLGTLSAYAVINKSNYRQKRKGYAGLLKMYCVVSVVITVLFGLLGKAVISLFYGLEYIESVKILYLLIPYFFMFSFTSFISSFLSYQKCEKELLISHLVMIIVNLIFNYVLIPRYGAAGAAAATDISLCLFSILLMLFHAECWRKMKKRFGS